MAEFWGRRWNLVAGRLLKALIYDPIIQACMNIFIYNVIYITSRLTIYLAECIP